MRPLTLSLTLVTILFLVSLCSGCYVQSLHPFAPEDKLIQPEAILGQWSPQILMGEEELPANLRAWKFQSDTVFTVDEENRLAALEVSYFKIKDQLYLQYTAGETECADANFYWGSGITLVFSLCKVNLDGDQLTLLPANVEYVKKFAEAHPHELPFVETDAGLIFTSSYEQWLTFIPQHDSEALFPEEYQFQFTRLQAKNAESAT